MDVDYHWTAVGRVLEALYGPLNFMDTLEHLCLAYEEAQTIPGLLSTDHGHLFKVITAPVLGHSRIDTETSVSVMSFYSIMIVEMINALRVSRRINFVTGEVNNIGAIVE